MGRCRVIGLGWCWLVGLGLAGAGWLAWAWLVLAGLGLAGAGWLAWAWLVLAGWLAEQVIGFDYCNTLNFQ